MRQVWQITREPGREKFRRKKTCASAQVGVIQVFNPQVDLTYQYLWDIHSINR